MKSIFSIISVILLLILALCEEGSEKSNASVRVKSSHEAQAIIIDVIQTSSYTYSLVKEGTDEYWIAFLKMNVVKGQSLFFNHLWFNSSTLWVENNYVCIANSI